jgi:hypothetical protein
VRSRPSATNWGDFFPLRAGDKLVTLEDKKKREKGEKLLSAARNRGQLVWHGGKLYSFPGRLGKLEIMPPREKIHR